MTKLEVTREVFRREGVPEEVCERFFKDPVMRQKLQDGPEAECPAGAEELAIMYMQAALRPIIELLKCRHEMMKNKPSSEAPKKQEPFGPQSDVPFSPVPDRYYLGMWHASIPNQSSRFGWGGNVVLQVHRPMEEAKTWNIIFRFRHYATNDPRAFDSGDFYSWRSLEFPLMGNFEGEMRMKNFMCSIQEIAGASDIDHFPIRGDHDVFVRVLQEKRPDWIQLRAATAE